jgi:arylsulfatase A-like enzyme
MHFYQFGEEWELYDLKTDPDELHNLYGQKEQAKISAKLKKQLVKLQKHYQDDSDISEKPVAWQKQVRPGE